MEINADNYFSKDNQYLSNSRISDFLKSPEYFYKKHVTKEIESKPTDAMIVGKAVDCWLTEGKQAFEQKFICVTRRDLKNPPEGITELNNTQYNLVEALVTAVEATTAYQQVRAHNTQEIFFWETPITVGSFIFKGLCGIPDWYKVEGDTCYITDLKTTTDGDARKYKWSLRDFGYYRQAGCYRFLIGMKYPDVKHFIFRHLVVEKDGDNINNVYAYQLNERLVNEGWDEVMQTIEEIRVSDFKKRDADFNKPILIDEDHEEEF